MFMLSPEVSGLTLPFLCITRTSSDDHSLPLSHPFSLLEPLGQLHVGAVRMHHGRHGAARRPHKQIFLVLVIVHDVPRKPEPSARQQCQGKFGLARGGGGEGR